MKYNLDPEMIKLEITNKDIPINNKQYQAKASYKVITYNDSFIIEAYSDYHDCINNAVKDAIKNLEWEVYYCKIRNNIYNSN